MATANLRRLNPFHQIGFPVVTWKNQRSIKEPPGSYVPLHSTKADNESTSVIPKRRAGVIDVVMW